MRKLNFDKLYLICLFLAFLSGYLCHSDKYIVIEKENVSQGLNEPIEIKVEEETIKESDDVRVKARKKVRNNNVITHVTLTTYNAVREQTNENNLITANGTRLIPHKIKNGSQKICAISRDLLWLIPFNSEIHIEGHGNYIVADLMNKRFNHSVDILQDMSEPNFRKEKVKVTLIRRGDLA